MSKPFMTYKHFVLLADMLNDCDIDNKQEVIEYFADRLQVTNKLFKREKFIEAASKDKE